MDVHTNADVLRRHGIVKPACCLCRLCEARSVIRNSGLLQVGTGELDYAETHTGECQDVN